MSIFDRPVKQQKTKKTQGDDAGITGKTGASINRLCPASTQYGKECFRRRLSSEQKAGGNLRGITHIRVRAPGSQAQRSNVSVDLVCRHPSPPGATRMRRFTPELDLSSASPRGGPLPDMVATATGCAKNGPSWSRTHCPRP